MIALLACARLVIGARRIGLHAWDALMDREAGREVVEEVARIVAAYPGVRGFHDLRTRRSGGRVFVQIHVELDGGQSLASAHAIGAGVRRAVLAALPGADVIVHKDPV